MRELTIDHFPVLCGLRPPCTRRMLGDVGSMLHVGGLAHVVLGER